MDTRTAPRPSRSRARPPAPAPSLEDVRRVLIGPEQERLEKLEATALSADTVGAVLPEAMERASQKRPQELAIALEPPVVGAVRSIACKESALFGEILSPTIGTAVRKAVADAFAAMLQRFNEALERSLSVQSIQWRIEARRTGRPFAEVVLLKTLVFRVEQVFLIHTPTSLVLQSAVFSGVAEPPPDQVAAMLAAIDAFAQDTFAPLAPGAHLGQVKVGDLTVWIEHHPVATIAAAVRGVAPPDLADLLRETRERISLSHAPALAQFRSDPTPFEETRPVLEGLLRVQRVEPKRRAQVVLAAVACALAGLVAAFVVLTRVHDARAAKKLSAYVAALEPEPGVVVTDARRAHGRDRIAGLRDPLAAPPDDVIAAHGLAPADLHFEPFLSTDPRIVEERLRRALATPPTATITVRDGVARAFGSAPRSFIEKARLIAPALPGVDRYVDDDLRDESAIEGARDAAERLDRVELLFATGSRRLPDSARAALDDAAADARALARSAAAAHFSACVTVIGHTDARGSDARNRELAEARAREVALALTARGVPAAMLRAESGGVRTDVDRPARARSASFRAETRPEGAAGAGCEAKP